MNKSKDGKLTKEELKEAFSEYDLVVDEQELFDIFYAADLNKDKLIDI